MPSPPEPGGFLAAEEARRRLANAQLALRRGQVAEAERAAHEALALNPEDADALEILGDALLTRSDFAGAATAFRTVLARDPSRASVENKLARATLRQSEDQRRQTMGVAYASESRALMRGGGEDDPGRRTRLAVLSAILPGLGQVLAGAFVKGIVLIVVFGIGCLLLSVSGMHPPLSAGAILALVILTLDWLYAVIDAARAEKSP
jgi:tetratricopeptide (TPR) repeat protein